MNDVAACLHAYGATMFTLGTWQSWCHDFGFFIASHRDFHVLNILLNSRDGFSWLLDLHGHDKLYYRPGSWDRTCE